MITQSLFNRLDCFSNFVVCSIFLSPSKLIFVGAHANAVIPKKKTNAIIVHIMRNEVVSKCICIIYSVMWDLLTKNCSNSFQACVCVFFFCSLYSDAWVHFYSIECLWQMSELKIASICCVHRFHRWTLMKMMSTDDNFIEIT